MRKFLVPLLFILISQVNAQKVVELDSFKPFELVGDTLFFNRMGYEVVKVVKPVYRYKVLNKKYVTDTLSKPIKYNSIFYVLQNDSTNATDVQRLIRDLTNSISASSSFKKYHGTIGLASYPFNDFYGILSSNCQKAKWDVEIKNDTSTQLPANYKLENTLALGYSHFPNLKSILDSISLLFNYDKNQSYSIRINFDKKATAKIGTLDECTNYSVTKIPNKGISDFELFLESYPWPILRIEHSTHPYVINYKTDYESVCYKKLNAELKNGFKNSVRIFNEQPNLFALTDSFNNATVIYCVGEKNKELSILHYSRYAGLFDLSNIRRLDINNDGYKDLVCDTNCFIDTTIRYLPNYLDINNYSYDLIKTLTYDNSLQNNYYYSVKEAPIEEALLFQIRNEKKIDIITYRKGPLKKIAVKRKHRKARRTGRTIGYKYQFFVLNNPKLTLKTRNPKKAFLLKQEIAKLLTNYIDNPLKILSDFPDKKK